MKKPTFIDAIQWFRHGDHPDVTAIPVERADFKQSRREKVGWLPTPEGGHAVFAGEWIIKDEKGKLSTCNAITFAKLYEPASNILNSARQMSSN